jgi:hypothetical protein
MTTGKASRPTVRKNRVRLTQLVWGFEGEQVVITDDRHGPRPLAETLEHARSGDADAVSDCLQVWLAIKRRPGLLCEMPRDLDDWVTEIVARLAEGCEAGEALGLSYLSWRPSERKTRLRHAMLRREAANLQREGLSRTAAAQLLAAEYGIDIETVRRTLAGVRP